MDTEKAHSANEAQVRAMRDAIYGTEPRYRTDGGWAACKEHWMRPEQIEWLKHMTKDTKNE